LGEGKKSTRGWTRGGGNTSKFWRGVFPPKRLLFEGGRTGWAGIRSTSACRDILKKGEISLGGGRMAHDETKEKDTWYFFGVRTG